MEVSKGAIGERGLGKDSGGGGLSKEAIIGRTHYGLKVYAHVLRKYYSDAVVRTLRGGKPQNPQKPQKPHYPPFEGLAIPVVSFYKKPVRNINFIQFI